VFGINSLTATRTGKAEFVLPVPMGSPQNYYGVGERLEIRTTSRFATSTSPLSGTWIFPERADGLDNGSRARSLQSDGSQHQWRNFNLTTGAGAIPAGAKIRSIEIRARALITNGTAGTTCTLKAAVGWNGGNYQNTLASDPLTTSETEMRIGGSVAAWGSHVWDQSDFINGDNEFRVRLEYERGNCNSSREVSVDTLEVVVGYEQLIGVPDPVLGTALAPQNFWGAIFTKGGVRQNGDYYAPYYIGNAASGIYNSSDPNPTYTASGYDYAVDFTGSTNGQVRLFDPMFCATGQNYTGGWYGAGDHWTTRGDGGADDVMPIAITYRLYQDVNDTPYITIDDTLVATLNYDPAGKTNGDFSGLVGPVDRIQNDGDADARDCSGDAGHNRWVTLASGLGGGLYRVNVETSSQAANQNVGAENMFSIWVNASGGKARVYGGGRMAGYTQIGNSAQAFYLAQIEDVHAGKVLEIKLFDPGDVGGDARLYIQSPDNNVYTNTSFTWSADAGCRAGRSEPACNGSGTYIQTAVGGSSSFDNSVITILIQLPDTYGDSGLEPPGIPGNTAADRAGWWRINYVASNANDTTTWLVNILGNPVHLKIP
jgi:hypothetical protein